MTTEEWQIALYDKAKVANPNLLIEDMSANEHDHIQPTDLNTFHMYPKGYITSKNTVDGINSATYPGSTYDFREGYTQDGDPWLNSEYGGASASNGDWDISWCFKYQTDILRQYEKLNGFVYTEPYDIEYERNGILTYDRRAKEFDDHVQIYVDNNPVPVIDVYNYSEYKDNTVEVKKGSELVVVPETY